MKTIILIAIYLFFLFLSCAENRNDKLLHPGQPDVNLIKLKNATQFDSIFIISDSIQLDNSHEAIIGTTWEAIIFNNNIIISDPFDTKLIKAFNIHGNFITKVGRNGNGPGEYISPDLIASNSELIVIYDPVNLRINIYDNDFKFVNSWSLDFYVENLAVNEYHIVLLRKNGMGYKYDFDIYDFKGEKVFSENLPKSNMENQRKYLFGGSYKIKIKDNNLYYIGADEYIIYCYDLSQKKYLWKSNFIPEVIKTPEIPSNLSYRDRISWMKNNYTSLYNFIVLDEGILIIHIKGKLILFDSFGNYLTTLNISDSERIYVGYQNNLISVTFPYYFNNFLNNPKIYKYRLIL